MDVGQMRERRMRGKGEQMKGKGGRKIGRKEEGSRENGVLRKRDIAAKEE